MVRYKTERTEWRVEAKITPVEVEKETDVSVWIGGRRHGKVTDWHIYHDTWRAAHNYLTEVAERHVNRAKLALEQTKGAQGNVKGMKEPVERVS